jgi:large subunit ribosomal protein L15
VVRKTKRFRGSRTHGRGKKHGRGAGGRGGTGNAGLHKHKFKSMIKYMPDHFGAYGFFRHAQIRETKAINIEEILVHLAALESAGHAKREGGRVSVDLTAAGFDKLLSRGRVGLAMDITVARASEGAVAKVAAAGGKVILPEGSEE